MEKTNSQNNSGIANWMCQVEEPFNPTDPIVVHDPDIYKPSIASVYSTQETSLNASENKTKVEAIMTPLINLNGIKLEEEFIDSMKIIYTGFEPKLKLIINDPERQTQFVGGPGLNNQVSVILTCPIDGMYKKISLPFYIKELKNLSNSKIEYECEYWHPNLNKVLMGQIGDKELTTYEFCEEISKKLHLGFAATEKCKDVSDPKWRQAYSQRVNDFIIDQIQLGGLDEESIFDCWIDVFGYLVLVNFAWVMHEKTELKNYSLLVTGAGTPSTTDVYNLPATKVKRVISNSNEFPFKSLMIINAYNDLYTKNTQSSGVLKTCWILNNAGDQNLLEKKQIQMIEESLEGIIYSGAYESQNTEFLGAEMADDTPTLFQRHVRNMYFTKFRSRQLIVELLEVNYGIQRGTLIYVINTESDPGKMQRIQLNSDSISSSNVVQKFNEMSGDENTNPIPSVDTSILKTSDVIDQSSFVTNPALSGFYYVDGIEYNWQKDSLQLTQILYLIKKDSQSSLINSVNTQKLSSETLNNE